MLLVDKRFRAHGPEWEVRIYGRARSSIERVNSRLEELVCLDRHRVSARALLERRFIEVLGKRYYTMESGLEFLRIYEKMSGLLD